MAFNSSNGGTRINAKLVLRMTLFSKMILLSRKIDKNESKWIKAIFKTSVSWVAGFDKIEWYHLNIPRLNTIFHSPNQNTRKLLPMVFLMSQLLQYSLGKLDVWIQISPYRNPNSEYKNPIKIWEYLEWEQSCGLLLFLTLVYRFLPVLTLLHLYKGWKT